MLVRYSFCFLLSLLFCTTSCHHRKKNDVKTYAESWLSDVSLNETVLKGVLGPIHGKIRPLICQFDTNRSVRSFPVSLELMDQGFIGTAKVDGSIWSVQLKEFPVNAEQLRIEVQFELVSGALERGSVAVAFDFQNWSTDNYVFVPAAAYNGNRFDVLKMPYPPFYKEKEYQRVDLPVTITDVPKLTKGEGPSKMELLTTDASTPAVGFYSPSVGKSFLMFTDVESSLGYHGITVEESMDRKHATIVISAPGVRQMRSGGPVLVPSVDRAATFKKGDVVKLNFLIDVREEGSITSLLSSFFAKRKDFSGMNSFTNRTPFSTAFKMVEKVQNEERWFDSGPYYKNGNGDVPHAHIQIGWVGGLMQPYPLLLAGNDISKERSLMTIETIFNHLQGSSGYFYGIYKDGKVYGDNFEEREENPSIAMSRKNADALYYIALEFDLLKRQGKSDLIQKSWEEGFRKLADAFVKTFKESGQFGQLVDVESGKIFVGGSTAPAIASAGLALTSQYFNDNQYLEEAEKAATLYYHRDVTQGYTTGGPGEILQNPDSESAMGMLESFMTLFEVTGKRIWLDRAEDMAALFSSWVVSYDFNFPPESILGKCDARSTGSVWASTQNNHSAPGICTSSGDALLRLYRATGNILYLDLLRDISHNLIDYMSTRERPVGSNIDGYINERVNISDWEGESGRGWVHRSSVSWCEMAVLLTTLNIPGIYVRPEDGLLYVFDHIDAKILRKDVSEMLVELYNPTHYEAEVTFLSENNAEVAKPLARHLYMNLPKVHLDPGERKVLHFPR